MATIHIRELSITRELDREAVCAVKGGKLLEVRKPELRSHVLPYFPTNSSKYQNVAVNAVQMASNLGFGAVNQNLGITVNANQG
ncbi:MAG: hypothetical protein PVF40_02230 [Ectothiorhodospiraceae bacterium]|jgi:hypothetical protein